MNDEKNQGFQGNSFVDIPGFSGMYQINRSGVVISLLRKYNEPLAQMNMNGYKTVNLSIKGKVFRGQRVHRLVALAFIPNPDNLEFVNHKDGNRSNNDIYNLEWIDRKGNSTHAAMTGLYKRKITELDVMKIRDWSRCRIPAREIARDIGVSVGHISSILRGGSWAHFGMTEYINLPANGHA